MKFKDKAAFKAELLRRNSAGLFPSSVGDECLYRGPKGRRCPVGVLIPDRKYTAGIEGATVANDALFSRVTLPPGVTREHLDQLQHLHDVLSDAPKWPKRKFAQGVKEILG